MSNNSAPQARPNILFILTDDHRYDTIGALGNPHIPSLDTLVRRGFAFDRSFCTTPICTPARAELLTGCTSFANHVPWFGIPINPKLPPAATGLSRRGLCDAPRRQVAQ